eukprot:3361514-Prymnesium_polylepis.1
MPLDGRPTKRQRRAEAPAEGSGGAAAAGGSSGLAPPGLQSGRLPDLATGPIKEAAVGDAHLAVAPP